MHNFTKYYSYNQLTEQHDILVMTQQEYLANKDKLDNPQQIVLVNRQGGPKKPKMPEWFKQWYEQVYENQQPKWFTSYMNQFRVEVKQMIDNKLKVFAKLNNLKYEE
ncbi:MAG: hypothetical protein KBS35_00085 [Mycoplasma sp.]|nr:hypothetical protein [Candidatus Hennigella equi]